MERLYAHSHPELPEAEWQTLDEHHAGVATLASQFATFGTPLTAGLLGAVHDTGKRSDSFQKRLQGKGGKVDHTTAAFLYLIQEWGNTPNGVMLARLLAYPLLGHHGGMKDAGNQAEEGSLAWRLSGHRVCETPDWKGATVPELPAPEVFLQELQPLMCLDGHRPDAFATAFLLRMLFSCLVDADFLDTERFCAPDRHLQRPVWSPVEELEERLFRYLQDRGFLRDSEVSNENLQAGVSSVCGTIERREAIRLARLFMLQHCITAADARPGLFSLTMPTGGGKTLSSLAFALRHARKHGLQRVIVVVPYTSIIEQNADVFREALGEEAVLEHHCNYDFTEESDGYEEKSGVSYKLSTENWDATLIVTTSVQFFETLFDNRPSRCRKLHNIAKSVIILDEAQMLPIHYLKPCLEVIKLITSKYGSSVVLSTATQPALMRSAFLQEGFAAESVYEMILPASARILYDIFTRTRVEMWERMDEEAVGAIVRAEDQILCIVNSRRTAARLFSQIAMDDESWFHLSALMTPDHRSRTLSRIRGRLAAGLPCRVVSTSLIECGVDISFPVVMREKNGLDVLAQAAGRCNREGHMGLGRVICFSFAAPLPKNAAELSRRRQAFDDVSTCDDLFSPETVQKYFAALYRESRHLLDEKDILKKAAIDTTREFGPWRFEYSCISSEFKFIEDDTASVVIETNEVAEILSQTESYGILSSSMIRKLQRHSVQVRNYELDQLKQDRRVEVRNGCLNLLVGGLGYSERTGLDLHLEDGLPVDSLII